MHFLSDKNRSLMNKTERSARVPPPPVFESSADAAVGTLFSATADALAAPETVTIRHHRWLWNLVHEFEVDPSGAQPRTGEGGGIIAASRPSFKLDKTLCNVVNWLIPDPNDTAARKC